jgi:CDP-diacylglycerol--serine O-phosphatidyltransferase
VYLAPNLITAFGLACGLFVIFKINMVEPGSGDYEVVQTSSLLLLVAALADFVDGALARAIRAESEFGFVFDSMADAITFGVAPSVLMLKTLSLQQGTFFSFFSTIGAMLFSLCGVLRLVRFNVKATEMKESEEVRSSQRKYFTGLPIPASAIAAVSANLFSLSPWIQPFFEITHSCRAVGLTSLMIILGYLMICRLKFPSLKMLHFKIPSFHLAFLMVVTAIFLLYGMLYFFSLILLLVAWLYIVTSLVLSLIRRIMGKKSKALEEFEPEPEDFEEL